MNTKLFFYSGVEVVLSYASTDSLAVPNSLEAIVVYTDTLGVAVISQADLIRWKNEEAMRPGVLFLPWSSLTSMTASEPNKVHHMFSLFGNALIEERN